MEQISVKFTDIKVEPPENMKEIIIPINDLGNGLIQITLSPDFLNDIVTLINLRSNYTVKIT